MVPKCSKVDIGLLVVEFSSLKKKRGLDVHKDLLQGVHMRVQFRLHYFILIVN
jgi:hypothetical protein